MNAEVAVPPLTVPAAMRAEREAFKAVSGHLNGYYRVRKCLNVAAISQTRTACGLTILAWIDAVVAQAEAEDHRDPVYAANACRERTVFKVAGPCNARCERAWAGYQDVRRTGDAIAVASARAEWRIAFVGGFEEMATRWAMEDQNHVDELRHRLDDSLQLDPDDAFPSPPGSRAEALVRASRERARRASIRRDARRYQAGLEGWRPAGR